MEALGKAVLVAFSGMALQFLIRMSDLQDKMQAQRDVWLVVLLFVGLLLVISSLAMLARQRLIFLHRTRHFWRLPAHRKKYRG